MSFIDFLEEIDNYVTNNYPQFPAAVFLMETFYVYREMFDFFFFPSNNLAEDEVENSDHSDFNVSNTDNQDLADNFQDENLDGLCNDKIILTEKNFELQHSFVQDDDFVQVFNNFNVNKHFEFHSKNKNFPRENFWDKFHFTGSPFVQTVRLDILLSRTRLLSFINMGGRGHRFLLTLEAKISRFKILIFFIF